MKKSFLLLFVIITAILFSQIQWQHNGIPVRGGDYIEWFKCAVPIDDDVIYIWSDARRGDRDLWAQKVDVNGNKLWSEDVLICGAIDEQEDVVAVKNENNEVFNAWPDRRVLLDRNIYAQKIDENGNILWQQDGLPVCTAEDLQTHPKIVDDENGGAFFFWRDYRGEGGYDIYGIHLLYNGEIAEGWEMNGNPIADEYSAQEQHSVCKDGNGGAIISWQDRITTENYDLFAQRVTCSGEFLWDNGGKIICNAPNSQERVKIISDENSDLIFVWRDKRNENDGDIYAQKIALNGNFLWENEVEVCVENGIQRKPQLVNSSDNSVIIVWEDGRNNFYYKDIYAQKIDTNGNILWGEAGISICNEDYDQYQIDIIADNNGGTWISWSDGRDNGYPNDDIYFQHLNSNGDILLAEDGNPICNEYYTQSNSKLVENNSNTFFVLWGDARTGSTELYVQTFDNEGNFNLPENGIKLKAGISGDMFDHTIIANGDNPIFLWEDSRHCSGREIYLQILNSDGSGVFEEDGIPITQFTGNYQRNFDCVYEQDSNCIAVVWEEIPGDFKHIYAQGIDLEGNFLWSEQGIQLADVVCSQENPHISKSNDRYYLGWSDHRDIFNPDIYGQSIIDGELQWSDQGVQISNREGWDELCDVVENFYIWEGWIGTYHTNIFVQSIDEYGNPSPGWSAEGLEVCGAEERQQNPKGLLVPEGLLIIWEDNRGDDYDIYGQLISADGNILWQQDGVPLVSYENEQDLPKIIYEEGIFYLVWEDFRSSTSYDIYQQKYDMTGTVLWESDLLIASGENDQTRPDIVKAGDKFLITYEDRIETIEDSFQRDIKAQLVSKEGVIFWENTGLTICDARYCQQKPLAVSNGQNDVYVAWQDERILVEGIDPIDLFAQKLYIDPLNIEDDEVIDQTGITLSHFPNPFGSSTTISFNLTTEHTESTEINIYNIKGQKVKTLDLSGNCRINVKATESLSHIVWNGKDESGKQVSSGIYFYKLKNGKYSITKKMLRIE